MSAVMHAKGARELRNGERILTEHAGKEVALLLTCAATSAEERARASSQLLATLDLIQQSWTQVMRITLHASILPAFPNSRR